MTGPWLVAAPASVLAVLGVEPEPAADLLYLSFVGVFVGAVGGSYLWALWRWRYRADAAGLRTVWAVTLLFRLAAGSFVLAQVALDNLAAGWLAVPAVDFLLAAAQVWLLRAGWPEGQPAG